MTCPDCGEQLPDSVNFCSNCGASLRQASGDTTRVIPAISDEAVVLTEDELASLREIPAGTAILLAVRGPNDGTKFMLDREVTTAGRSPKSDIFLDDVTVSRHHAKLTHRGGHVWISDQNSLNGTYVNRTLIDGEIALRLGDEVQIGKFRLVFLVGSGSV